MRIQLIVIQCVCHHILRGVCAAGACLVVPRFAIVTILLTNIHRGFAVLVISREQPNVNRCTAFITRNSEYQAGFNVAIYATARTIAYYIVA